MPSVVLNLVCRKREVIKIASKLCEPGYKSRITSQQNRNLRNFSIATRSLISEQPEKVVKQDVLTRGKGQSESNSTVASKGRQSNSEYCLDLVRKFEYEGFLCGLLLPDAQIRSFLFAVRAFNVEIASIRDQVSQKDIGLGRLAFWRSAVDEIFRRQKDPGFEVPRHPVVQELHHVIGSKSISKRWLVNLMDARESVMNDVAFKDLNDLEAYCDKSVSSIFYLGFEFLGIKNVDVDHAASHLGKSIGLANFIRSIPHNAQRRRVLIPQELLRKHKLSQESLIRMTNVDKIQDAVFEIASQAHMHYKKALSLKPKVIKEALPLMLIGTPTDLYLKRLERRSFNPYNPSLNRRYGLLPLHLYFRKVTGKYF